MAKNNGRGGRKRPEENANSETNKCSTWGVWDGETGAWLSRRSTDGEEENARKKMRTARQTNAQLGGYGMGRRGLGCQGDQRTGREKTRGRKCEQRDKQIVNLGGMGWGDGCGVWGWILPMLRSCHLLPASFFRRAVGSAWISFNASSSLRRTKRQIKQTKTRMDGWIDGGMDRWMEGRVGG